MKLGIPSLNSALAAFLPALVLGGCAMVSPATRAEPASPPAPPPPLVESAERPPFPAVRPVGWNPALARLPEEVRGLWVVRFTLAHPDSVRVMVERAAQAGFNTLIVQVRGRGDAYYRSQWEPRPEGLDARGGGFDPLALLIREAHARGLMVHAWINSHFVGGLSGIPTDPRHIIRSRPDLLAVPRPLARELFALDPSDPRYPEALLEYALSNRDQVEGIYSSPSAPEVKEHIYSVWMDLVESYDLDGLHFDYIRYPNPDFDYSAGALNRFRSWVRPRISSSRLAELEMAFQTDPLAYPERLPELWDEFRRNQISELVERIYHGVKKRKPEALVSAAVFANAEDAYRSRFQDWRAWVREGILDVVAPMAYTPDNGDFRDQVGHAVEVAGGERVWAGIGAYQNSYEGTLDKIRIARQLRTRGVVLFSYDWAVAEGESQGNQSLLDRIGQEMFRRR